MSRVEGGGFTHHNEQNNSSAKEVLFVGSVGVVSQGRNDLWRGVLVRTHWVLVWKLDCLIVIVQCFAGVAKITDFEPKFVVNEQIFGFYVSVTDSTVVKHLNTF